jgi:group I intron endonuclease
MNNAGIYKIINTLNHRIYIGSSVNLKLRKARHFTNLTKGKHENSFLQNDFNKCGSENFKFEIILFCDKINLMFYEQRFLDKYYDGKINCYNISKNSVAPMTGRKHSAENVEKFRLRMLKNVFSKGTKRTPEQIKAMSESLLKRGIKPPSWKGKTHSDEAKKKMSEVRKGKTFSEEHKQNMKLAQQKRRAHT